MLSGGNVTWPADRLLPFPLQTNPMRSHALLVFIALVSVAQAQTTVVLRSFWSSRSNDNATSSWSLFGGLNLAYSETRAIAHVFSPANPQPADTVALHTWYSSSRREYLTSSSPSWQGGPGQQRAPDYTWNRLEGYVFEKPLAGTVKIVSLYSPSRNDNYLTTNPLWKDTPPPPDYFQWRVEGYGFPIPDKNEPVTVDDFHVGTMNTTVLAPRPLVTLMARWRDTSFTTMTPTSLGQLMFGPQVPNANSAMLEQSQGKFSWTDQGVFGPLLLRDDPDTTADESLAAVAAGTATTLSYISLKAKSGPAKSQVVALEGGGGQVEASSPNRADWETFGIVDLNGGLLVSGDRLALKTCQRFYLNATAQGECTAVATMPTSTWAQFTIYKAFGGTIADKDEVSLKNVQTGLYLSATNGGAGNLRCDAAFARQNEKFILTRNRIPRDMLLRDVLARARTAGFNVAAFDRDGNGEVHNEELDIAVFYADLPGTTATGQTTWFKATSIPGVPVSVRSTSSNINQHASFLVLSHELSHCLGTQDLYGSGGSRNFLMSLMGGAWAEPPNGRKQRLHLDAWHRIRLGFTAPRLFNLNDPGGSAVLKYTVKATGLLDQEAWPVLLYDPARYNLRTQEGEYFLLEYRTPAHGIYDASLNDHGLFIWRVATKGAGHATQITARTNPLGTDSSVNLMGAPNGERGGNIAWNNGHRAITLTYDDGSVANCTVRVAPHAATDDQIMVEWSPQGGLRARLDLATVNKAQAGSNVGGPGSQVCITGEFPADPTGCAVVLRSGSQSYSCSIQAWSVDQVDVLLPGTAASSPAIGLYDLVVTSLGGDSNFLPFTMLAHTGVVSPIQQEVREGIGSSSLPFSVPQGVGMVRYQQGHGDMRGSPRTIGNLSFRRDGTWASSIGPVRVEIEVFMAHCNFDSMTSTYDENYTSPLQRVVKRRKILLPHLGGPPNSPPARFAVTIPLDQPFAYDGVSDLVWEVLVHSSTLSGGYVLDSFESRHQTNVGSSLGGGCVVAGRSSALEHDVVFRSDGGYYRIVHRTKSAPASTAGHLNIDFSDSNLRLPGLCGVLHAAPAISIPLGVSTSRGTTKPGVIMFKNITSLVGARIYTQALFLDPSQQGLPVAMSNGVVSVVPGLTSRSERRVATYHSIQNAGTERAEKAVWGDGLIVRFN